MTVNSCPPPGAARGSQAWEVRRVSRRAPAEGSLKSWGNMGMMSLFPARYNMVNKGPTGRWSLTHRPTRCLSSHPRPLCMFVPSACEELGRRRGRLGRTGGNMPIHGVDDDGYLMRRRSSRGASLASRMSLRGTSLAGRHRRSWCSAGGRIHCGAIGPPAWPLQPALSCGPRRHLHDTENILGIMQSSFFYRSRVSRIKVLDRVRRTRLD